MITNNLNNYKTIHQIWIGDQSLRPQRFMDTWKMKGWEYRLWTEEEIQNFGLKNKKLFDFYYKRGNYHGASDVVRVEVLERFGGFYIDADTERLEEIDSAPFMEADFMAVEANMLNRVANGIIGAVAHHPILREYRLAMGKAVDVLPPWSTIGGTLFTKMIEEHKTFKTMILEPHTFYPHDSRGKVSRTSGKSYARHVWGTTHKLYGKI